MPVISLHTIKDMVNCQYELSTAFPEGGKHTFSAENAIQVKASTQTNNAEILEIVEILKLSLKLISAENVKIYFLQYRLQCQEIRIRCWSR